MLGPLLSHPHLAQQRREHRNSRGPLWGKTHFADLNGTGGPWEAGQTCLKGRDLAEGPPAAGVDPSHTELVGRARLQFLLLQLVVVRDTARVVLRRGATRTRRWREESDVSGGLLWGRQSCFANLGTMQVHVDEGKGAKAHPWHPFHNRGKVARELRPGFFGEGEAAQGRECVAWLKLCTWLSRAGPPRWRTPWDISSSPGTCLMARIHPPESTGSRGHLHQMGQHHLVAGNNVSPLHWCP